MPTATATTTASSPAIISLKGSSSPSSGSTVATLRSLYPRAARAFLQRNVSLTHSLLTSAFSVIQPPALSAPDSVASHRRKWDILRITFETTLYASPPFSQDPEDLPASLRANLMLSPEPLVATLHSRSLLLFTPSSPPQKPTSAFLPAQILVTLVLASLKLECITVGRSMIEDWLARRSQEDVTDDRDGYAKVLELYCLHVLPRLEEWEYAEDFLQYERELSSPTRKYMQSSLHNLHCQAMSTHRAPSPRVASPSIPSPSPQSSRPVSPSPSISSASTSSSTSTHTATPTAPRPGQGSLRQKSANLTRLASSTSASASASASVSASSSSQSISSTATSRTVTPASVHRSNSSGRTRSPTKPPAPMPSTTLSPLPRVPRSPPLQASAAPGPSVRALLRSYADTLLLGVSRARLTALIVFCVALPLLSFVLRMRRRRVRTVPGAGTGGTTEEVRRRLRNAALVEGKMGPGNVVRRVWAELVRAVLDTVQMGGRGLV